MTASPQVFSTPCKVRFSDVDPAGIAYYPTVVGYLHTAFEEFFEQFLGRPYADVVGRDGIGFPAVDLKMTFHRPLRFGETIDIAVSIVRISRSSVDFRYRLWGPDRALRAEARVTVVTVELAALRSIEVPSELRRGFERALENSEEPPE